MERPKNVAVFLEMMKEIAHNKEKHQSMLFEEIEKDVKD